MLLGAKEPNRNYTVCGKFKSPISSRHLSREQRICLAINKIAGFFYLLRTSLTIKNVEGLTHDTQV